MLFWAASEALTAVAFLLSTVHTLKALSPGKDYDGDRKPPEYDILRVWACLGLLTAAEQYLGWVLWHLPFYGAAKCVMLGVAITLPEARVAPILFDRAVVPSMERLDKYLGHPLINSLFKHLWDVPIFFLELFIYPTDRAEDEDIKWSLTALDEIEIHTITTQQRMDGGVCKEKMLDVGIQAPKGSHSCVLKTAPSRKKKVRTQEQQRPIEPSRRHIGEVKLKKPARITKGMPQRKNGNGGQTLSSKTRSNMTITGPRTRSAAHVVAHNEEEKCSAASLVAASKGRKNTKPLTYGQRRAAKRPSELNEEESDNKIAKLDTSKRKSNNQAGHGIRRKELKVVKELGNRRYVQPISN
eukprot:231511_1